MKIKMAFSRPFTLWVVRQPLHSVQTQGPAGSEHASYSVIATHHSHVHIFISYKSAFVPVNKTFLSYVGTYDRLMTQHVYVNANLLIV